MTFAEFVAHQRSTTPAAGRKCPICKQPYAAHGERYKIGDQETCSGCYFDALGELVEQHPIGGGRRRG